MIQDLVLLEKMFVSLDIASCEDLEVAIKGITDSVIDATIA